MWIALIACGLYNKIVFLKKRPAYLLNRSSEMRRKIFKIIIVKLIHLCATQDFAYI